MRLALGGFPLARRGRRCLVHAGRLVWPRVLWVAAGRALLPQGGAVPAHPVLVVGWPVGIRGGVVVLPVRVVGVLARVGPAGPVVLAVVGGGRSSAGRTVVCRRVVAVALRVPGLAVVAGSSAGGLPVVVDGLGGAVAVSALTG